MYTIVIDKVALKELKKFPKNIKQSVDKTVTSLTENPFPVGVKKIKGLSKEFVKRMGTDAVYRIRVADYRIIYTVYEDKVLICVVKVGMRKDVYRFVK